VSAGGAFPRDRGGGTATVGVEDRRSNAEAGFSLRRVRGRAPRHGAGRGNAGRRPDSNRGPFQYRYGRVFVRRFQLASGRSEIASAAGHAGAPLVGRLRARYTSSSRLRAAGRVVAYFWLAPSRAGVLGPAGPGSRRGSGRPAGCITCCLSRLLVERALSETACALGPRERHRVRHCNTSATYPTGGT
jgi:hypothetical protein